MQKLKRAVQNSKSGLFFLPLALIAGAFTFTAPVFAAPPVENTGCILDQPNNKGVNCNSNDITLSSPIITVIEPCDFPGDIARLQVLVDVTNNATQRYDIGVWLSVDGDPNGDGSASGVCSVLSLDPTVLQTDGVVNGVDGDACGDVASTGNAVDISQSDLGTVDLLCEDNDGDGNLDVPLITSWKQKDDNDCPISSQAWPGTSPKCTESLETNLAVPIPARVIVTKNTPGGDPQAFNFDLTGPVPGAWVGDWDGSESFPLADTQSYDTATDLTGGLPAGNGYSVTETPVAGFASAGSCVSDLDGIATNSDPASLNLRTGETVSCTFTNTPEGSLTVTKLTFGGDGTFGFVSDLPGQGAADFNIATTNGVGSTGGSLGQVPGGAYNITEDTIPAGWAFGTADCLDQNQQLISTPNGNGVDLNFADGATVSCTFRNVKLGTIVVRKVTSPAGTAGSFTFTGDAAGSIGHNGTIQVSDLQPGTYTSTESAAAGFNLTNVTCNDNNSFGNTGTRTATFNVEAGETVTCTFTNTVPTIAPPPAPSVTHAIPVNNPWVLLLMVLMVLGVGWHFRPARRKQL